MKSRGRKILTVDASTDCPHRNAAPPVSSALQAIGLNGPDGASTGSSNKVWTAGRSKHHPHGGGGRLDLRTAVDRVVCCPFQTMHRRGG